jgi:hypothetical protein
VILPVPTREPRLLKVAPEPRLTDARHWLCDCSVCKPCSHLTIETWPGSAKSKKSKSFATGGHACVVSLHCQANLGGLGYPSRRSRCCNRECGGHNCARKVGDRFSAVSLLPYARACPLNGDVHVFVILRLLQIPEIRFSRRPRTFGWSSPRQLSRFRGWKATFASLLLLNGR